MADTTISKEEMAATRVARFKGLKPWPEAFVDTAVPEFKRDIFSVIGAGVLEDPDMAPKIGDAHPFSIGLIRMEPGAGYEAHRHLGSEDVLVLQGGYRDAIGEYDCGTHVHTVVVVAINGGDDSGRLTWHPELIERAKQHGAELDETGFIKK